MIPFFLSLFSVHFEAFFILYFFFAATYACIWVGVFFFSIYFIYHKWFVCKTAKCKYYFYRIDRLEWEQANHCLYSVYGMVWYALCTLQLHTNAKANNSRHCKMHFWDKYCEMQWIKRICNLFSFLFVGSSLFPQQFRPTHRPTERFFFVHLLRNHMHCLNIEYMFVFNPTPLCGTGPVFKQSIEQKLKSEC